MSYSFTARQPLQPRCVRFPAKLGELDASLVEGLGGSLANHIGTLGQHGARRMSQEDGQGFRLLFRRKANNDFHRKPFPYSLAALPRSAVCGPAPEPPSSPRCRGATRGLYPRKRWG